MTAGMQRSKMAPLCLAGRLPLLCVLLLLLILSHFAQNVSPLLVYDRQTLLNIRNSVVKPTICGSSGQSKTPPPFLSSVPSHLWRVSCPLPTINRYRRRSRRGSRLVRLRRAYLIRSSAHDPHCLTELTWEYDGYVMRRSSEYCYRWLRPTVPDAEYTHACRQPVRICRRHSVKENLRPIARVSQQSGQKRCQIAYK